MISPVALFLVCNAFRVFEPAHHEADPIREVIPGTRQMQKIRTDRSTSLRQIQGDVTYFVSVSPGRFLQASLRDAKRGVETEFAGSVSAPNGSQAAFAIRIPSSNLELSCEVAELDTPIPGNDGCEIEEQPIKR